LAEGARIKYMFETTKMRFKLETTGTARLRATCTQRERERTGERRGKKERESERETGRERGLGLHRNQAVLVLVADGCEILSGGEEERIGDLQ